MCDHCGAFGEPVELTEENEPYMIHEVTIVALHAASAYSNGWIFGAKGLFMDMVNKWQQAALVRSAYVWGAARFFLPAPPGGFGQNLGHDEMAHRLRRLAGEEPELATVTHLVAVGDQADAAIDAITQAASKGDIEAVAAVLEAVSDSGIGSAIAARLMGEAGARMRYAHEVEDDRAVALFDAHVQADMPDDEDEENGDDEG
jgi:hypothetical protein